MPILLLLFIAVPIAEIALFIEVGDLIGLWPTLATVVVTALVGTTLVRQQGLAALTRARSSLERERLPVEEIITGVCLLVAGALLLTPGFLTDAIGLSLLIPPLRLLIGGAVMRYIERNGHFAVHSTGPGGTHTTGTQSTHGGPRRDQNGKPIIDGDFEEVDPDAPGPDAPRPDAPRDAPNQGEGRLPPEDQR
jgi:UPF0716 protein FxsA